MSVENPKCETCRWAADLWEDPLFNGKHIRCRRYPKEEDKLVDDFCGEHSSLAHSSFPFCSTTVSVTDAAKVVEGCQHEWATIYAYAPEGVEKKLKGFCCEKCGVWK